MYLLIVPDRLDVLVVLTTGLTCLIPTLTFSMAILGLGPERYTGFSRTASLLYI